MHSDISSLERVAAYGNGERVDRIPYSTGAGESMLPYYGISNREYLFSAELMADTAAMALRDFGGDGMGTSITARAFAEAAGSQLSYPEWGYSTIEKHLITDYRKFPARLPEISAVKSGRLPIILDALKLMQKKYGNEYSVGFSVPCPANCALGMMPVEQLARCMVKRPDLFHELMEFCLDAIIGCVKVFYEETGMSPGIFDVFAGKALCGNHYEEMVEPYIRKMVDRVRSITGETPGFGTCGSQQNIWDSLLDMGVTGMDIDHKDSLRLAREKLGEHVFLSGNIDPLTVFHGTPEEIESAVFTCLMEASDNPMGYNPNPGGAIYFGTPAENIRLMAGFIEKYGRDARKGELCPEVSKRIDRS